MLSLPKEAQFLEQFRCAFTAPTYERFLVLCVGAIVTMGRQGYVACRKEDRNDSGGIRTVRPVA